MNTQRLTPWEEVIGEFRGIEMTGDVIIITINNVKLVIPSKVNYLKYINAMLNQSQIGMRVGLLLTDNDEFPIRIRYILDCIGPMLYTIFL